MSEIAIRPERPDDWDIVHQVHASAFPTPDEADLVAKLRSHATIWSSLVASLDDDVIGHIMFTPVGVLDVKRPGNALALGPLGVLPEHQNRGIGSALVREGLSLCRARGEPVVFVLGHANYYPRFGFELAWPKGLYYGDPEPNSSFFVIELEPGALDGRRGEVRYHPAFYEM